MTETPVTVPSHDTVPEDDDDSEEITQPTWFTSRFVFRVLWGLWVFMGLFLEFAAVVLFHGEGDTLSEQVWTLFELAREAPGGAVIVAGMSMLIIGFFGWLTLHFLQRLMSRNRL